MLQLESYTDDRLLNSNQEKVFNIPQTEFWNKSNVRAIR